MIRLSIMTIFTFSLLIGCSNPDDNGVVDEQEAKTEVEDSTTDYNNEEMDPDQDQMILKMERLPFTEFELEVTYDSDVEYEAELDRKSNGHYEVKLDDEINNVQLKGVEAFDQLYPIIKELTITEESTDDEVITDVLNQFNLEDNYNEFELEIKFNDGLEYEYKDKK